MKKHNPIMHVRRPGSGQAQFAIERFTPSQSQEWFASIMDIYRRMRAKTSSGPYTVDLRGLPITVLSGVYAPCFFTDTRWFSDQLVRLVGRGSLLEIGTGTGAIAAVCAHNGASVVATDINPQAIENARLNAQTLGLPIDVRFGDLFEALSADAKFDYIFWAHPFNNWDTPVHDMLLRSGLDENYRGLRGYISGAGRHLKAGGRLLLGTGDSADLGTIFSVAKSSGYVPNLINSVKMPLEYGGSLEVEYLLYEFVPQAGMHQSRDLGIANCEVNP